MSSYDAVKTEEDAQDRTEKVDWIPFLRQLYVVTGVWMLYFSLGLSFGAPTVFIAQIRREANSTDAVSPEMESWLTSIHGYSSVPFVFITPISAQIFGRKIPFVLVCLISLVGHIVLYCSTNTMHILISEMIQGALLGSNMTLLIPVSSEYTSPHYRAILLTIKAICFFWGMWIANIVGTFFHWKNIGIIGLACCVYSLSSVFWPESPSWLAMKGRYAEAAAIHHWLKGYDEKSEKELENLIESQKEYRKTLVNSASLTMNDRVKLIVDTITTKGYYYPLLLTIATMSLYHFSGKFVCMMYAIQLIHQITHNEETAYMGMLLLEGITITSMSFGCFISKYMKRKTLLVGSTAIAVVFLYLISLYLYLISLGYLAENKILSLVLLSVFSMFVSCGPYIIASPLFGEILLLQYRCSSLLILTVYSELLMAIVLQLAPVIFRTFSLHGAFLFYGILATVFTAILHIYLPETKGKSIQEIEDLFRSPPSLDVTKELIKNNQQ